MSADFHQFYLWDRGVTDQAPEHFTDDDVTNRIKTGPHVVVIQPERNTRVPVEIEVHDSDPGFAPTGWDHIAEASLQLPTGRFEIEEWCANGPAAAFRLKPDWYRVRSLGKGFSTIDETGCTGDDSYHIQVWPAPAAEVRVLKQWEPPL